MAVLIPKSADSVRTQTLDVTIGGPNGFMPNPMQWSSNAPYVPQQTRAVLLSYPLLMNYLTNPAESIAALKALIEVQATKIDGLHSGLSWDYDGPMVGNAGEKFEAPTKASRAVSAPTFEWPEKYGQTVTRFWTELGRMCVMDPDLQAPGIISSPDYLNAGSPPILPEHMAMTILFFEPDTTLTNVTKAWIVTNMMPRTGGDIDGKAEKGGSSETPVVSIEFTAYTQTGQAPLLLAKSYLSQLALSDLRPLELQGIVDPYNGIDPDILNAGDGLASMITNSVMPPSDISPEIGS